MMRFRQAAQTAFRSVQHYLWPPPSAGDPPASEAFAREYLRRSLHESDIVHGVNSWRSLLYEALLADPVAFKYLMDVPPTGWEAAA
jgi:hypothetical protein